MINQGRPGNAVFGAQLRMPLDACKRSLKINEAPAMRWPSQGGMGLPSSARSK
jgi:hypothetical protein